VKPQRTVSIILVVILALMVCSEACSAREYAGLVLDPQAMQGIKRVLVAWNKGNMAYSEARWAVTCFEEQKLKNVQLTLWDGQPFDLGTFDALVVVDAFSLDHRKYSKDIYVKDWVSRFGHASDARYIPAQLTAEVKAAWVTLYLLRVESDRLSPGASSTSRWLAPIVYINSEGGGTFTFDDPSDSSWESGFMGFCTSSKLATRLLVNALVKDMRSIDPENWE